MSIRLRVPSRSLKQPGRLSSSSIPPPALRHAGPSLEPCCTFHFSHAPMKERTSFQPMKKDVTRSSHANKIPPTTSPSGSVDPSKVQQTTPTTTLASSAKANPDRGFDSASLLRSTYNSDRPVPKPLHLRRHRNEDPDTTKPSEKSDSTKPQRATTQPKQIPNEATASSSNSSLNISDSQGQSLKMGSLASNSIFADEVVPDKGESTEIGPELSSKKQPAGQERVHTQYVAVLNPRPKERALWHRRMVIRSIRRRGRLTKKQTISRTERSSLSKSHFFKTSIKKLAPLARQIAGKPIDEAILQMRFSKKKAAREVLHHLRHAKNEAVVRKGMGLGLDKPESTDEGNDSANHPVSKMTLAPHTSKVSLPPPSNSLSPRVAKVRSVHQRPHSEAQLSQMYISQAWVNRGPYGKEPEFRAMGRVNMLRPPHTGLSVLVKEERTRVREQKEKDEKAERRRRRVVQGGDGGMWMPMPDRKITTADNRVLW